MNCRSSAKARGFAAVKTNPLYLEATPPRMFDPGFRMAPGILDRNPNAALFRAKRDGKNRVAPAERRATRQESPVRAAVIGRKPLAADA